MPVYFAYGSNLDRAAMALRCPQAVPIGLGTLARHSFFIMANGYASVRPEPEARVDGLLWNVPDTDIPALDAYEEIDTGLYRKAAVPVETSDGLIADAMIYIGLCTTIGRPQRRYMEAIMAAALALRLPAGYREELRRWRP